MILGYFNPQIMERNMFLVFADWECMCCHFRVASQWIFELKFWIISWDQILAKFLCLRVAGGVHSAVTSLIGSKKEEANVCELFDKLNVVWREASANWASYPHHAYSSYARDFRFENNDRISKLTQIKSKFNFIIDPETMQRNYPIHIYLSIGANTDWTEDVLT